MSKVVTLPSGEGVSFKKAFSESNSRKHFFLINGRSIQNYTGSNDDYCQGVFKKAKTVYGPVSFDTAKRLASESLWPVNGGIKNLEIKTFSKFRRKK